MFCSPALNGLAYNMTSRDIVQKAEMLVKDVRQQESTGIKVDIRERMQLMGVFVL